MKQGPMVSELGWRWVTGQIGADEYFARVEKQARRRAAQAVRSQLSAVSANGQLPRSGAALPGH